VFPVIQFHVRNVMGLAPEMDGGQGESSRADGGEKEGQLHDGLGCWASVE
jgi:hypothetical protein